jgi:hypothetical protein
VSSVPARRADGVSFGWPRFRELLGRPGAPRERFARLLASLAGGAAPPAEAILRAVFDEVAVVGALARLAPVVDHVGLVAPAGLSADVIEDALRRSPFARRMRRFRSEVWAREVSQRFGRAVEVTIVQAWGKDLGVEVFVAALRDVELDELVAEEAGCHVALALDPRASFDEVRALLHAHGHYEPALMRGGPSTNAAIDARLLYVDVERRGVTRRLEIISGG